MILKLVREVIIILVIIIIGPIHARYVFPIAKPGCDSACGDVPIPYPFGMKGNCYAEKWFEIECRDMNDTTYSNQKPYLKSIGVEVTDIDVSRGTVEIKNPIYRSNCGKHNRPVSGNISVKLEGSPFVYSQDENKLVAAGCNKIAFLQVNGSDSSGCVTICDKDDDVGEIDLRDTECNGKSCCETSLPLYLSEYSVSIENLTENSECSYAMIVRKDRDESYFFGVGGKLKHIDNVPAVLEWEILNNSTTLLKLPQDHYARCYNSNVTSSHYKRSGQRCSCTFPDYYGTSNPYIAGGCPTSIDRYWVSENRSRLKPAAIIGVSASLGFIILLLILWWLYKVARKHIVHKRKEMFFKKNGGLLLEQRLSSGEVNDDKVKLFSLRDLEKATDHFNKNRVLGKGGQGTVYKGMLTDGKIIAVKKFKVEGNVEEFINEFVILSQINHRNVVKLLGSCLETEIPLLVYEFIPNGNLFEYLHEQNEDLPMTWNIRLRIAAEIAGALFYLHSAASRPIYHRDIKSTNILLDEKYRAKVADFGTSRMVSIEATHLTTIVQGTFGYLDPEYFHTSQFTEKSDVYSFGVVLVELFTGQKPISFLRPAEAKSLASYFILCMEENRLCDIIDERVVKEGEKEHIMAVANLASRCLELNGKKRPTMKEVTLELEGIRKLEGKSNTQEKQDELEHVPIGDYQSWAEYSTASNTRSTTDLKCRTPSLEGIHILTI